MSKPWSGLPAPVKLTVGRSHKATQKKSYPLCPRLGLLAPSKYFGSREIRFKNSFGATNTFQADRWAVE